MLLFLVVSRLQNYYCNRIVVSASYGAFLSLPDIVILFVPCFASVLECQC